MPWVQSLQTTLADAQAQYPAEQPVASVLIEGETYWVSRASLNNMVHMHLGSLPLATIAIPNAYQALAMTATQSNTVRDIRHHLSEYFPNTFVVAIYELQSLFHQLHQPAYIIGGITRDMLLSAERRYEIQDVDITVEGNAIDTAKAIVERSKNFTLLETYPEFGTAKLDYRGQIQIDLASTRQEAYETCGALPHVLQTGVPLAQDILRRDFTVNALALSIHESGRVIDCSTGLPDLEQRQLQLLKPESFYEDPSRIIRAFKFTTRKGFRWHPTMVKALANFVQYFPPQYKGGGDRMKAELESWWDEPAALTDIAGWQNFIDYNLHCLWGVSPSVACDLPLPLETMLHRTVTLLQAAADVPVVQWKMLLTVYLLGLPPEQAKLAANRLMCSKPQLQALEHSQRLLAENTICLLRSTDAASRLYDVFHAYHPIACMVGVLLSVHFKDSLAAWLRYNQVLRNTQPFLTGEDIMGLGLPSGEAVGKLLKQTFCAQLDGLIHSRTDALSWAERQLSQSLQTGTS